MAFVWGFGAAVSLIIGAFLASYLNISRRVVGLIMAFGVGVLISAVAFELAEEAFSASHEGWSVGIGLIVGGLTFFIGDVAIDKLGGHKHRLQKGQAGSGMAILLGTILDGIPESIVIGLTLLHGGVVSIAMIVAVFLSNLPEAIGATSGLISSGWSKIRVIGLWACVAIISGIASWTGYTFFGTASPGVLAFTLAFAAGALLTMLADSMMPEAFRDSGKLAGLLTTFGFGIAFLLSMLS